MTREQEAELVNACNDGLTGRSVSPVLTRLRTAWLEADANEREIFKTEISLRPSSQGTGTHAQRLDSTGAKLP